MEKEENEKIETQEKEDETKGSLNALNMDSTGYPKTRHHLLFKVS
jgi:hypothetical protein